MRKLLTAAGLLAAMMTVAPVSASAFGETCYPSVTATGREKTSMRLAMWSAVARWEAAADRKHGGAYDEWYYSGDRTIDCKWDSKGTRFTCKAKALPCGPHHH